MVKAGRFLEHACVFDNYYGTSRETVERGLQQGKDVILDIDWQGARAVKKKIPQARSVFILPPSRAVLQERLGRRGQDSQAVVDRRMLDAVSQMRHHAEFDYVVLNDDFDAALQDLKAITRGDPGTIRQIKAEILTALLDNG